MAKCDRCRNCDLDWKTMKSVCTKGKTDLFEVEDLKTFELECDEFDSRYIEYPITVNEIKTPQKPGIVDYYGGKTGSLVKFRPCSEEYGNKTYLGILLGEVDINTMVSYSRDTKELNIIRHYNPAIFVPELAKIIYGCESWWGIIKSEDELKQITNADIDEIWYVKLLQQLIKPDTKNQKNKKIGQNKNESFHFSRQKRRSSHNPNQGLYYCLQVTNS